MMLRPDAQRFVGPAIGVDVGGTSVKGLRVSDTGDVVAEIRMPTPSPDPDGSAVVAVVARVVDELRRTGGAPVGVVVPGIVDETRGQAVFSANLGWRDIPLRALLQQRLGEPVAFGHDVRAGALAEVRLGAGVGRAGMVAFVPVGTGIAAAFLDDGRPIVSGGWAGEIGQLPLFSGPFAGLRVEEVASAASTARRASLPDARAVAERVRAGDESATQVWNETVAVLADVLATVVTVTAPTTIIVGGGLALAGDILFAPLARQLASLLPDLRVPTLVAASLGDRAAALGAALGAASVGAAALELGRPGDGDG
jgi:glucokinase